jgi:hypothetical protein
MIVQVKEEEGRTGYFLNLDVDHVGGRVCTPARGRKERDVEANCFWALVILDCQRGRQVF